MGRTRRTVAAGVAIALAYALSALVSGRLSPSARRPMLDGLAPPQQYLWVDPPAALESTNVEPVSEQAKLGLTPRGSPAYVLTTADAQATLILPEGAVAARDGQADVELSVDPLDPASLAAPDPPLSILGNVYRFQAAYEPGGETVEQLAVGVQVVLVYPLAPNDHGAHRLLFSPDGTSWTPIETNDTPAIPQVDGTIDGTGYVAVAGEVEPDFSGSGSSGLLPQAVAIVVVVALAFLAVKILERRRRS